MKVIITESQYKNVLLQEAIWWDTAKESANETIISEEIQYNYIQKVVQHLVSDIKGGAHTPSHRDIIQNYGLTQNDVDYLNKLEEEALDRLKGVLFNVSDYRGRVSIGGYDFKFVVRGLYGEEYMGVNSFDDNDKDTFPQVNWTVEAGVLLRGGTVELMIADPDNTPLTLQAAIDNPDYGWEIESEIGDLIHDIIYAEELILPALGASISVDQSYE